MAFYKNGDKFFYAEQFNGLPKGDDLYTWISMKSSSFPVRIKNGDWYVNPAGHFKEDFIVDDESFKENYEFTLELGV